MTHNLASPHWYRVAPLKPLLQSHIRVHRTEYRGLIWYVLEDISNNRNHRFNPTAYQFIGLMDGERSVDEIHEKIVATIGSEYAPTQGDVLELLAQLHSSDLIQVESDTNIDELLTRQTARRAGELKQRFLNPLAMKIPLWDPDAFLARHQSWARWIFSWPMAIAWLLLVASTAILFDQNRADVLHHGRLNALEPYNLLLLFVLYPVVKVLHELAHGFCIKLREGEVHEMGVTLLLLLPVPYVDASAATHFRSKYQRMLVSAVGIFVETAIAAIGLRLFLATEPGLVNTFAFDMFLIGGVSSLLFNANPLLKYDGYYILSDALGIPNLYRRSGLYWQYLFKRYLFGVREAASPATAPGEAPWLATYCVVSLSYRFALLWFIFLLLASVSLFLATVLAVWIISLQFLGPVLRSLTFLLVGDALRGSRIRAVLAGTLAVAVPVGLMGFVPAPDYTRSQGVLWQPDDTVLTARESGFVEAVQVGNGRFVEEGTQVLRLADPLLTAQLGKAEARVREASAQYRSVRSDRGYEVDVVAQELRVAESELDHVRDRAESLTLAVKANGTFYLPEGEDLIGRYVRKGEVLGYLLNGQSRIVRVAVRQDDIGHLKKSIQDIEVRFASLPGERFKARIVRESPEGSMSLPSPALGTVGGGPFVVIPGEEATLRVASPVFLVDLEFNPGDTQIGLGTRAYVRFDHGESPLLTQFARRARQVFLRQLSV